MLDFPQTSQFEAPPQITVQEFQSASGSKIESGVEFSTDDFIVSEFDQRFLPLGSGEVLELRTNPEIHYNFNDFQVYVPDWNVKVNFQDIPQLPRLMVREFMRLFRKSDLDQLNEEEQSRWLALSDIVNFDRFSRERAAPRYLEGTLKDRTPKCLVQWNDQQDELLSETLSPVLSFVDVGERFGLFAKFDENGMVVALERVALLDADEKPNDENWAEWPPAI